MAKNDLLEKLELPDGWTKEVAPFSYGDVALFMPQEQGDGVVTIDFKRRIFSGGYGPVLSPATTAEYEGRGWRRRLVSDAVRWLQDVFRN